jgi:hypothetical protein
MVESELVIWHQSRLEAERAAAIHQNRVATAFNVLSLLAHCHQGKEGEAWKEGDDRPEDERKLKAAAVAFLTKEFSL